jgi:NitT/TauT family transport system substrate-binding protein
MIMKDQKLFEAEVASRGLNDVKANYVTFPTGAAMNDAVISGSAHFAVSGIPAFATIWSKTRDSKNAVKAAAAVMSEPLVLTTRDPNIKSIEDYKEGNKIALGGVKVSIQAVTLQMAVAAKYGIENFDKLDSLTTTLSQGDGMVAIMSGTEIDSHFTSAPFHLIELQQPEIKQVLSSYDVVGKHHTSVLLWSGVAFHDENPQVFDAFMSAFYAAQAIIRDNPDQAADIYLRASNEKVDKEFIAGILKDSDFVYSDQPVLMQKYLDFMHQIKSLKQETKWSDLFFEKEAQRGGS